jgi:hypothetical protein
MPKREKIDPNSDDSRYVRRDAKGRFTDDQVEVGRSLSQDMKKSAQSKAPKGEGDRGDKS